MYVDKKEKLGWARWWVGTHKELERGSGGVDVFSKFEANVKQKVSKLMKWEKKIRKDLCKVGHVQDVTGWEMTDNEKMNGTKWKWENQDVQ